MKYTLKAIRINKNLTQQEAAEGIGISVETLANYEKGVTSPDILNLKKIERFYNVNYNDICFFEQELQLNCKKRIK